MIIGYREDPYVPTFEAVLLEYLRVRRLQPKTTYHYKANVYAHLSDWLHRPVNTITKNEVLERHQKLTETSGPGSANITFRIFRGVCNYAIARYEDADGWPIIRRNPVNVLKEAMVWNKQRERVRHLSPSELPLWWSAVQKIENRTTSDFLAFCLFTGCRKSEATGLKWSSVNIEDVFVVFEATKNGHSHKLPVCSQVSSLLARRKQVYGGMYVFPQATNPLKPYDYKHYTTKAIHEDCGILISPHDLRRTYATVCSTLRFDILLIKRLLNHANRDITERYIMRVLEPFRTEIQQAGDTLEALIEGRKHIAVDCDKSLVLLDLEDDVNE